jgi:hypothetical protein
MDVSVIIILVLAAVALAAVWYFVHRRKSSDLKGRFGPEYEAEVRRHGDARRAETELERRVKRVERFHIKPLSHTVGRPSSCRAELPRGTRNR